MSDAIPIIPKAGRISIHTGNIVNWNRLKRKLTQSPTEELSECVDSTISTWLEKANRTDLQYAEDVSCANEKFAEKLEDGERDEYKITVKIFLSRPNGAALEEAVERALQELGVSNVETVLISLPEKDHTLDSLKPVWETLERLVDSGTVYSIGTADLDKPKVEELYNWAKIKPCINQVNLETCCVMPADLVEYAKENDIQLLTHNDPKEILTAKRFRELVASALTARDSELWAPSWVARYSVVIKCRGIIKSKGYIVRAVRETTGSGRPK